MTPYQYRVLKRRIRPLKRALRRIKNKTKCFFSDIVNVLFCFAWIIGIPCILQIIFVFAGF